ncbi:EAL domain-containing protein [Thioalkalivibrio sp. ALMg3]|uniref:EAL domain-containing protein n=1 Tax=Thioalkalivibrio sp. ALMg3 TaxID=1158163 RepID=UPI00036C4C7F|nr:EAL domain-containing protein [Thioalkalivibrio sp. ALMg3]
MPDHPDTTRYQRIFEQAPEAHLVLDRKGGIVAANYAACELLGYTSAELTGGVHITELDLQATQDDVDQAHSNPEQRLPAHFESRYRRSDGGEFPAEVHINAIRTDGELEVFATVRDITRERQSEQALKSLETQLGATIRHAPLILFALDADGRFTLSEGAGLQALGLNPGEVVGRNFHDVYADQPGTLEAAERALAGEAFQFEDTVNGTHLSVSWIPMKDPEKGPDGALGVAWDVTSLRAAEAATGAERDRLLTTLQSISDGVITADTHGRLTYLNPAAQVLLGLDATSAQGHLVDELLDLEDTRTGASVLRPVEHCLNLGGTVESPERILHRADGETRVVRMLASPLQRPNREAQGVVVVLHDHTELWQMTQQLNHQATHDDLTGLCNRREFERRLDQALHIQEEGETPHAVFYMDLDQFKIINDTCGHQAGDELLRELSERLRHLIRENDTLARLGGDEFGVLLYHCPPERAEAIARKMLETVQSLRFAWEGRRFDVGVSIGLVPVSGPEQTLPEILSQADSACYAAKENGRNQVYVWQPSDQALRRRRGEMEWVGRIRSALEEGRFALFGQAVHPLGPVDPDLAHVEVLMRLRDEDGRLIPPGSFIPAAERYHLMPDIDRHIIDNAFAMLARHRAPRENPSHCDPTLAINLSGQSLAQESMLEFVTERLQHYAIPPRCIIFEITETAAISHHERAQSLIRTLRYMGCRFSLDDFGSGLSSFGYLKNLPVDFIKVDGSFVRDIAHNAVDSAMVTAIHRVGHVLGLRTIAECVESAATMDRLREIGLDFVQGFYLSEPAPLEQHLTPIDSNVH